LIPAVPGQWFDNNGDPAAGAKMFTYAAGTTTKINTYSDVGLTTPNANPVVLDSAGRATIFLTPGTSYKFVLAPSTDTDPPTSPIWTRDNISAIPASTVDVDVTGVFGETITAGQLLYLSDGTGGKTAGRWYLADADNDYQSTLATQLGFAVSGGVAADSVSIRVLGRVTGLSGLTAGAVYYVSATAGSITSTPPAKKRKVGTADTTTSFIISRWPWDEPQVVGDVQATVGNVGAGEDILKSLTLAAGRIDTNGMSIKMLFGGKCANNANSKTVRLRVVEGANNTVLVSVAPVVSQANEWLIGCMIKRTGATTARATAQANSGPTTGPIDRSVPAVTQPTVTWGNAVEIRLTGEGVSDNDITVENGDITIWPPSVT
jgi:hypothetical protein